MSSDGVAGQVIIPHRFRGPPDSANGGYACGVVACHLHGPSRVRLHRPPPLDRTIAVEAIDDDTVELRDDEIVIATGSVVNPTWQVPPPVDYEIAVAARARFAWFRDHPFAGCFVCGPEREDGDGLRIFPGTVAGRELVAAPWVPAHSVCDATGTVQPEIVWAALDCPSWFGILAGDSRAGHALLGQLAAQIHRRPRQDEGCVVIGWSAGREGRKLHGGSAIFDAAGSLLASSFATWIELKR